jgi:probable rRNA maturation factor
MPKQAGIIQIHIADAYRRLEFNSVRLRKMLRILCGRFNIRKAVISIAVADDKQTIRVNEEFLDRSAVTDVISFDLSDENSSGRVFDLVINAQEAKRQAKKRGHSAEAEFALYVVHGFLHNVGFDDTTKQQAARMHKMEDHILEEFGYGKTYLN